MPNEFVKHMTAEGLVTAIQEQEEWIRRCGGDLDGYIQNYGSKDLPNHFGDGAEAIYKADMNYLTALQDALLAKNRARAIHTVQPARVARSNYHLPVTIENAATKAINHLEAALREMRNDLYPHSRDYPDRNYPNNEALKGSQAYMDMLIEDIQRAASVLQDLREHAADFRTGRFRGQ